MNERIRELAEQAGMYIIDDKFSTYGKFAENFAELIIRECANYLEIEYGKSVITGNDAADFIRKHFGVSE